MSRIVLVSILAISLFAGHGMSQVTEPAGGVEAPYPDAVELVADQEFVRFQARHFGSSASDAEEMLSVFTTSSPFDRVLDHLAIGAVEVHRESVAHPDSAVPGFLGSLTVGRLDDLARLVESDRSGPAYRESFLAAYDAERPEAVEYAFVAHEEEDGTVTYYEIQRPYFHVSELRWRDATRIRVIHLPFNPVDP